MHLISVEDAGEPKEGVFRVGILILNESCDDVNYGVCEKKSAFHLHCFIVSVWLLHVYVCALDATPCS